jgi:putative ABC transport system permease protein
MSRKTLWNTGLRYLTRHAWQSILMVLGITLGVAVVISVDLANASASRAFDLSTETITGKTTHQITGGPQGLDESIYTRLRLADIQVALAPVISGYGSSPALGGRPMQLLGVDPFAEAPFRNYLGSDSPDISSLTSFLTQPGAILISQDLARRYSLQSGQTITLEAGGNNQPVFIAGLLQPEDDLSRRALDGLVLMDIATAQELMGKTGTIDRIDLIFPPNGDAAERVSQLLPPGAVLQSVEARSGVVQEMTSAFRVNLTALSLLALVVGMFLIYNTITFSVVQRRPLFGTLRCLGVTRQEVFGLVLGEALIVGLIGAFLGALLGILMGQGAVQLVTQTINDLFFVVTVRGVQIPLGSLLKGSLLGLLVTVLSAAPPAWEAASVPPRAALSRSTLESKAFKAVWLAAGIGLMLILLGVGLLAIPSRSLITSFSGTFALIVGFAMLTPLATGTLMRAAAPTLRALWGALGSMAPRRVANSLSRTSIAVMALMVAVSVTIGVSLMVTSFRSTVITWLEETLQGDIYLSAPSLTATTPSVAIEPQVVEYTRTYPGVQRVDVLRSVTIDSPSGPIHVSATDNPDLVDERKFLSSEIQRDQIWSQMQQGTILVTEPLANRLNLPESGATIELNTSEGLRRFPVGAIVYDYSSSQGSVIMSLPVYRQNWKDQTITAIALHLAPGLDPDQVASQLQDQLSPIQSLNIRANQALRQEVLVVFDRTFAITGALQLLATIVAFIGVLSALLSLELERQRELGILRSIGLSIRQLWGQVLLETGLMGAVAGLIAMPTGYVLALILVYIINRRSFGWTLQMQVEIQPFIEALAVAIIAALLAGLYPALRMSKIQPSEALRSE